MKIKIKILHSNINNENHGLRNHKIQFLPTKMNNYNNKNPRIKK